MLLVDRVEAYSHAVLPVLRASRLLAPEDPVFAGHFPGSPSFPGALLLEALAQTAALLSAIERLVTRHETSGGEASAVLSVLTGLDRTSRPSLDPAAPSTKPGLPLSSEPGMLAASDIKFIRPARPGDHLFYEARRVRDAGRLTYFEVEAEANGQLVAKGTLILARMDGAATTGMEVP
jgi:3-hydroxymyristoyl/3-hydroxydecanoyl-(acyl carrier protein) dehydratase